MRVGLYSVFFVFVVLSFQSLSSEDFIDHEFEGLEFQNILTSTRLKTSHRDAPASVSIITSEDIARYRFRNVPEALKTVPGFFVAESHSSYDHYFVGYHGGNANVPRRTNLIIDGISFYQSGLSRVHWEKLPLIMSDIHTIEVIRGPASSLYGSNSFTSVVNITTKKPKETIGSVNGSGVSIDGRFGEPGVKDISISYSNIIDEFSYRASYIHTHDDGFDITRDNVARRDSLWVDHFSLKGNYYLNNSTEIDFELGHTNHRQQEQFLVSFQNEFPDYQHTMTRGSVRLTSDLSSFHNIQISSYFKLFEQSQELNASVPAFLTSPELQQLSVLNSLYANSIASGVNPIGSGGDERSDLQALLALTEIASIGEEAFALINIDLPQNFEDDHFEIEIQDTYSVSDDFRLLTGGSLTYVDTSSFQWVINGDRSLTTYRAFFNVEWKIRDDILLNGGSMFEYDKESGSTFSPRAAISYHINDHNSLRYVYSTATRTPDIFEQFADWRLIGQNPSSNPFGVSSDFLTFYARGVSPGSLNSEEITSNEIGYYYLNANKGVDVDLRIYHEDLTQLISEKLELRNFNPTNNGYATKKGFDFQTKVNITNSFSSTFSYSYIDLDSVILEKTITPRHILSAGVSYRVNPYTSASLSYYGFSEILAASPSSNPGVTTTTEPLDTLEFTLQFNQIVSDFDNFDLFITTRYRNGNAEVQVDNLYSDSVKTIVGFSLDI